MTNKHRTPSVIFVSTTMQNEATTSTSVKDETKDYHTFHEKSTEHGSFMDYVSVRTTTTANMTDDDGSRHWLEDWTVELELYDFDDMYHYHDHDHGCEMEIERSNSECNCGRNENKPPEQCEKELEAESEVELVLVEEQAKTKKEDNSKLEKEKIKEEETKRKEQEEEDERSKKAEEEEMEEIHQILTDAYQERMMRRQSMTDCGNISLVRGVDDRGPLSGLCSRARNFLHLSKKWKPCKTTTVCMCQEAKIKAGRKEQELHDQLDDWWH